MLPLSRNSCRTRGRKAGAASTEHGSTRPCPPPMCLELARKRLQKADKSSVGLVYRERVILIWSPFSYSKSMMVCSPCCARKEGASLLPPVLRGGSVAQAGPLASAAHRCQWYNFPAIPLTPVPNHRPVT